jgi:hypothetical protein
MVPLWHVSRIAWKTTNGYAITAEQERFTYEEGAANREIIDENIFELL